MQRAERCLLPTLVEIAPARADFQLYTRLFDFNFQPVKSGLRKIVRNVGQQVLAVDIRGNVAEIGLKGF